MSLSFFTSPFTFLSLPFLVLLLLFLIFVLSVTHILIVMCLFFLPHHLILCHLYVAGHHSSISRGTLRFLALLEHWWWCSSLIASMHPRLLWCALFWLSSFTCSPPHVRLTGVPSHRPSSSTKWVSMSRSRGQAGFCRAIHSLASVLRVSNVSVINSLMFSCGCLIACEEKSGRGGGVVVVVVVVVSVWKDYQLLQLNGWHFKFHTADQLSQVII